MGKQTSKTFKIDIGSGALPKPGFKTVDLFCEADYNDDIRTMKTFKDNSVDWVNCSHLLEHIADEDLPKAFQSIYRVLRPGGRWSIEVPDLIWLMEKFVKLPEEHRWGWNLQTIFGLQHIEGEYHKTGFSLERLGKMLKDNGFTQIKVWWVSANESIHNQQVIRAVAYKPLSDGYDYLQDTGDEDLNDVKPIVLK